MGGEDGGHTGNATGVVAWLDEFDPDTGTWTQLADAPRIRDHHQAAIVNDKMYVIGGRDTATSLNAVIQPVDVYDFNTSSWSTIPTLLPTGRSGCAVVTFEGEIYVMGGESSQFQSHVEVEVLNPITNTWRTNPPMNLGRHGIQAVVNANSIYVIAGSKLRGEGKITRSDKAFQEVFTIKVDNELTHESLLRSTGEFWLYPAKLGTQNNPNLISPLPGGFRNIKFERGGYRTPECIFMSFNNESLNDGATAENILSDWNLLRHSHPATPFYLITDYCSSYSGFNCPDAIDDLYVPDKFIKDPNAFMYDLYLDTEVKINTPFGDKDVHRLFYAYGFDKYAYGSRVYVAIDDSGSMRLYDFTNPNGLFYNQWQQFQQDCVANGLDIVSVVGTGGERWSRWFYDNNIDCSKCNIANNAGDYKANIIGKI